MKAAPGVADLVSRDPAVVEEYKNDPLVYTEGTKVGMARVLMRAGDEVVPFLPAIELPLLVMHGTGDKIIDPESSGTVYDRVSSPDKTFEYYEGLYHEIFNEPEREEVFADVARWLGERNFSGKQEAGNRGGERSTGGRSGRVEGEGE
jgi:alpha-beta hydrolase superfamily lysophospholipase